VLIRRSVRAATIIVAAVAVLVAAASPAFAHVEATIDNPQAGATNVTLTLTAEAESATAGISGIEVALPAGITAGQVTLKTGPAGWTMSPTSLGVAIAGNALPVGTDAQTALGIATLPATATVLVFKTLVTYSDGHIDRWIDETTPGAAEPEHPAPTVSLQPAVPGAGTSSPAAATAPTSAASSAPSTPGQAVAGTSGSSPIGWIIGGVVLLLILVVAGVLLRRRRAASQPPSANPKVSSD
jgi:Domain of unkown function (DUF1775)